MDISHFFNRAVEYLHARQLTLTENLGSGQEGYTWETSNHTAIKVFERTKNFNTELICYQILEEHNISSIGQFNVPTLIDSDESLSVIEMTIVSPPFILDFGKCHFSHPDFSDDVIEDYEQKCIEYFGEDWETVSSALATLRQFEIFYYDARPGNINVDGLKR